MISSRWYLILPLPFQQTAAVPQQFFILQNQKKGSNILELNNDLRKMHESNPILLIIKKT